MPEKESPGRSGGIGFVGLLQILFIGLKLTGYIDWSWWWVMSPMWISALLILLVLCIAGFYVFMHHYLKD